jgi:chromosome segregation and condensation protein ScpB
MNMNPKKKKRFIKKVKGKPDRCFTHFERNSFLLVKVPEKGRARCYVNSKRFLELFDLPNVHVKDEGLKRYWPKEGRHKGIYA